MTVTPDAPSLPPDAHVFGMWQSCVVSEMLRVAGDRQVLTQLMDGPRTSAELAAVTGTHEPSLHRLLRALAGLGLVKTQPHGWALTPTGVAAAEMVTPLTAWADASVRGLGRAVETGRPAMTFTHGCTVFEYFEQHPEEGLAFDRLQARLNAGEPAAVAEAYDFTAVDRVVDVGGGNGTLLAEVLPRHPHLHAVLFDLARTVEHAIPELDVYADRVERVGGDFFEGVPRGADLYLLSHILHDWPEPQAISVLARIREAIAPTGRLLVVEMVMPADDTPHPARMLDITLLLLCGGMERTEDEYAALLARGGFRLERVIPTRLPVSVLEAVPV
jgi:DNA-binding HxlR family transcriptional regulator